MSSGAPSNLPSGGTPLPSAAPSGSATTPADTTTSGTTTSDTTTSEPSSSTTPTTSDTSTSTTDAGSSTTSTATSNTGTGTGTGTPTGGGGGGGSVTGTGTGTPSGTPVKSGTSTVTNVVAGSTTGAGFSTIGSTVTVVVTTAETTNANGQTITVTSSRTASVPLVATGAVDPSNRSSGGGGGSHTGPIVGGVVGGVGGLLLLSWLAFFLLRRRRRAAKNDFDGDFDPDRMHRHSAAGLDLAAAAPPAVVEPFPLPPGGGFPEPQPYMHGVGGPVSTYAPSSAGRTSPGFAGLGAPGAYPHDGYAQHPAYAHPGLGGAYPHDGGAHAQPGYGPSGYGLAGAGAGRPLSAEGSTLSGSAAPLTNPHSEGSGARGAKARERMRVANGEEDDGPVVQHRDGGRVGQEIPPSYDSVPRD